MTAVKPELLNLDFNAVTVTSVTWKYSRTSLYELAYIEFPVISKSFPRPDQLP
jgi:hypothetical protein